MFKTAAAHVCRVKYEGVVVIRNLSHHCNFRLYDSLYVAPHTLQIVVAFAVNHYPMRNAPDFKRDYFEPADLKGRIIKYVEVFGAKCVWPALYGWKSRSNSPVIEWNDC